MPNKANIGLIGDYDATVPAHQAIPLALQSAAQALRIEIAFEWVPTEEITSAARISGFNGLWCVPASPYRNMDGALLAIRHARENAVPFLGTCGGFQHAVVEYARNVLGWADAEHAESAPGIGRPVISPLECALVEATGKVRLFPGTRIAAAYGAGETMEGYRCRYGLNPEFQAALIAGPLRAAADDETGEIRAVELDGHPFFVATLFQPERAALKGQMAPLVVAFLEACAQVPVSTSHRASSMNTNSTTRPGFWERQSQGSRVAWAVVAVLLFFTSPLWLMAASATLDDWKSRQSFDSAIWKTSLSKGSYDPVRITMIDDLLKMHSLVRMNRSEIVALLGIPPATNRFSEYQFVYWLGPERSVMSIDSEWLAIRFDADGHVSEARIVSD